MKVTEHEQFDKQAAGQLLLCLDSKSVAAQWTATVTVASPGFALIKAGGAQLGAAACPPKL